MTETTFTANPTQRAFIESRAEADLFASRKGEGKSAGLCWSAFYYTYHNPGAQGICVRDTYENLQRTTLKEWFHWFPPGVYGDWIESKREWHWDKRRTGLDGCVTFLGASSKDDAQRIASMPLAFGLADEPAPAGGDVASAGIDEYVMDTIMGQLRQPGMRWYAMKLATNNPDQSHWSFKRFVKPGTPADPAMVAGVNMPAEQESGYRCWQTRDPENIQNLPPGYYEAMAKRWANRPDLLRRFVAGKFGFQSKGKGVTPEWSDDLHLSSGLRPIIGAPLKLGWDGGHNPTCIISQQSPLGDWLITDAFVGDKIGTFELIEDVVKPRILDRYPWVKTIDRGLRHTGDPNMDTGDQGSSKNSPVKFIMSELGGVWIPGPIDIEDRVDPLRAVLRKTREGRGLLQVDRELAERVWWALRGGWHYRIARSGVVGSIVKDEHSHPGDATGYLAAQLYPQGKATKARGAISSKTGNYFDRAPGVKTSFIGGKERGIVVPRELRTIGKKDLPLKM